jgi:hypothetical protein
MIECIFTIDYEIYGNGEGSLRELVYEPAERLMEIFQKRNVRFVPFVEVAEFELIEKAGSDPDIRLVKRQIQEFHEEGFELGLHLHPQWYNAKYEDGKWLLDYNEYNLSVLPRERIAQIVERGIAYLRDVLGESNFTPQSYRAGNWLFQPTRDTAAVLVEQGIKVDSSVFKGGLQHSHGLDYRRSLKNGYYWKFLNDVNIPDPHGTLIEIPIYTQMVPPWQMLTSKRIGIQKKSSSPAVQKNRVQLQRIRDYIRFRHPLKFDFCRMTIAELTGMVDKVIREDCKSPSVYKPLVAIGHTKDLVDFETVELFLAYLHKQEITVATFADLYGKVKNEP